MSVISGYNKHMFNRYSNIENVTEYYIIFDKYVDTDEVLNIIFNSENNNGVNEIDSEEYYQGCIEALREDLKLTDEEINSKILTSNFGYKYYNRKSFRVLTCYDKSFTCISIGIHYTADFSSISRLLNASCKKLSSKFACSVDLWCRKSFNSGYANTVSRIKQGIYQLDSKIDQSLLDNILTRGNEHSKSHALLDNWFKLYYSNDLVKYLDLEYGFDNMSKDDKRKLISDNNELYEQSRIAHIEIIKQGELPPITSICTSSHKNGLVTTKLKTYHRPTAIVLLNKYGTFLTPLEFTTTFKLLADKFYNLSLHKELEVLKLKLVDLHNELNALTVSGNVKTDSNLTIDELNKYISEHQELYGAVSQQINPNIVIKERYMMYE